MQISSFIILWKSLDFDIEFQWDLVSVSTTSYITLAKKISARESNLTGFKVITATKTLLM